MQAKLNLYGRCPDGRSIYGLYNLIGDAADTSVRFDSYIFRTHLTVPLGNRFVQGAMDLFKVSRIHVERSLPSALAARW